MSALWAAIKASWLARRALAVGAALLAVFAALKLAKREGRRDYERDALEDSHRRQEAGRQAVEKHNAEIDGLDRADRLKRMRERDGAWD